MKTRLESPRLLANIGFGLGIAGVVATALAHGQWSPLAGLPFLIAGYVVLLRDARAQQKRLNRFFEMSLDLFCVAHKDGYFKVVNPAFSRALGWSTEEILKTPYVDLVHPDDVAATLKEVERLVSQGQQVLHFENRYRHKDGSWRVLAWRSVPQPGGYIYATARDVTVERRNAAELREARDAADAANRAKSTFLATMSHEIRTPLNGVIGMLELLSLTPLDREQRGTVDVVRKSGESLKRIIDDILEFSKIEAGRLEIHPEAASIEGILGAVQAHHSALASAKGLVLEHRVDPRVSPAVKVDALRLQQILHNFVSNALKFTTSGRIAITADLLEHEEGVDRVRFAVSDTGIGISAAQRQGLFQPFAQADGDTTRRFGGTGLGLTISSRLATLMGGTVDLQSEPGRGTTIALVLPLPVADPRELASVPPDSALAVVARTRCRITPGVAEALADGTLVLLVDDHPTNRLVLQRQLNLLGYAAQAAEDGARALEAWQANRFGLVLADCHMPKMDGYELARRIRALEAQHGRARTPIVACTANALRGEAAVCLAAGMDDYLAKPVRLQELQVKLDRWLPLPESTAPATLADRVETPGGDKPAAAPLNRSTLAVITGGDATAERSILADFKRLNDSDVAALEAAVARHADRTVVMRASHRIKGVSWMVGAVGLARACETLERASRGADWESIERSLAEVHRETKNVYAYIDGL